MELFFFMRMNNGAYFLSGVFPKLNLQLKPDKTVAC